MRLGRRKMELIFKIGCSIIVVFSILTYLLMEHQKYSKSKEVLPQELTVSASRSKSLRKDDEVKSEGLLDPDRIHLVIVACGDRLEETVTALKSAVLLARRDLHYHIFTEENLKPQFIEKINSWPKKYRQKINLSMYPITYPKVPKEEWVKVFKLCATQRLFLPDVLPNVDAVIYIDTDILFMRPIDDLWDHFKHFNSTQIAALTPETEDKAVGWYNRFARHPYYPPLGVNSGVMMMNLTRMRSLDWIPKMVAYFREYKLKITWGDQDLINIYFSFYPDKLYIYPCEWNYRPDHCMYMSICRTAEQRGVMMLHGSRQTYHSNKQPAFKAIYEAFYNFDMNASLNKLLEAMKDNLEETKGTNCGKISHLFYKKFQEFVRKVDASEKNKENPVKDVEEKKRS